MCSTRLERAGWLPALCLAWLLGWSATLAARGGEGPPELAVPPLAAEQEAWLITVAPGDIYWQRFGHNAIWLREPARGLDHTINFGYFDFEQENFLARFMLGRMLYQSLAFASRDEFSVYARESRSILAQKLNLDAEQFGRLRDHLLWHVRPENRDYRYDYYLDNCSTRIRDAIDLGLDGALSRRSGQVPAGLNFRDHTRRLTSMDFWYYLGLQIVLGTPVDRPISRWEEMFIPGILTEAVSDLQTPAGPLASGQQWIFKAPRDAPPAEPPAVWPRYLLLAAALGAAAWLAGRWHAPLGLGLSRAWIMVASLGGMVLLLLWTFTDHAVAGPNANLLLLNPAFAAILAPRLARPTALLMLLCALAAAWLGMDQGAQYNLDVLALALPLNVACALKLARGSFRDS